ncbi:hypothetical protein DL89DRAFT_171793 [Linderina pennispora]|uniref:Uncharacterized protein n=1 Tax=Linderina pennispora TaxID=61395 RepID=A0A1Y1W6R6_9FUNG|nr:uncharacterized protein DL89DRAFT_171793 [Linderina pennispora]ORX69112.1 hypothetical protein DL89DRAFT_171793 [Linderina pennispora]
MTRKGKRICTGGHDRGASRGFTTPSTYVCWRQEAKRVQFTATLQLHAYTFWAGSPCFTVPPPATSLEPAGGGSCIRVGVGCREDVETCRTQHVHGQCLVVILPIKRSPIPTPHTLNLRRDTIVPGWPLFAC